MHDSHAWRSKILITRICTNFSRLTEKCEFLARRPIKCKFSSQFVKTAGKIGSGIIFGIARNESPESFGYLRKLRKFDFRKVGRYMTVQVCTLGVTSKEQNFEPVRNPQSFDTSVDGKNVGYMSIVEPKPRCAHLKINRVLRIKFSSPITLTCEHLLI